jgi:cytochrome c oxidase subunit 2
MKIWKTFFLICAFFILGCRKEYTTGPEVFQGVCVKCHKLNGKGGKKGPELTDIFSKKDEDYIRQYIMDPRSIKPDGTMPPAKISDHELDLVIQYLKQQDQHKTK